MKTQENRYKTIESLYVGKKKEIVDKVLTLLNNQSVEECNLILDMLKNKINQSSFLKVQ